MGTVIGGSMQGRAKALKLDVMPCGKWSGYQWRDIPDGSLKAMLEWWTSGEPANNPQTEAIVNALTDEYTRRISYSGFNRTKRKRKHCGNPRSAVSVTTKANR